MARGFGKAEKKTLCYAILASVFSANARAGVIKYKRTERRFRTVLAAARQHFGTTAVLCGTAVLPGRKSNATRTKQNSNSADMVGACLPASTVLSLSKLETPAQGEPAFLLPSYLRFLFSFLFFFFSLAVVVALSP